MNNSTTPQLYKQQVAYRSGGGVWTQADSSHLGPTHGDSHTSPHRVWSKWWHGRWCVGSSQQEHQRRPLQIDFCSTTIFRQGRECISVRQNPAYMPANNVTGVAICFETSGAECFVTMNMVVIYTPASETHHTYSIAALREIHTFIFVGIFLIIINQLFGTFFAIISWDVRWSEYFFFWNYNAIGHVYFSFVRSDHM